LRVREFFKVRHIIPGATFLLIFFICNWRYILTFFRERSILSNFDLTSSVIITLTGTVGLTTIGFLLSQIWFGFFWIGRSLLRRIIDDINPAYQLLIKKGVKPSREILQAITDYHGITSDENIHDYLSRRLDITHIFGTSVVSILTGLLLSIIFRSNIDFTIIILSIVIIIGMSISFFFVWKENWRMVEYILQIKMDNCPDNFWRKIPKAYLNEVKK